jgi:hypothetical protein
MSRVVNVLVRSAVVTRYLDPSDGPERGRHRSVVVIEAKKGVK